MKIIKITLEMSSEDYLILCDEWDNNDEIGVDTSTIHNEKDIVNCANIVMSFPKREFSSVILEELSEKKETPMEVLKRIVSLGDQGCIESVCMRSDLSNELIYFCHSIKLQHYH